MKVSLKWIQEFTDVRLTTDQLVEKIGAQLGAVESVADLSDRYKDTLVVKVVSCRDHTNSDHLKVCLIDDGQVATSVKRDGNKLVQIVCGANNVRTGMMAVWLPPGSVVPDSVDSEPLVLEAREIRGELSNGMLASPRELGLSDERSGILEIDKPIRPGKSFADSFQLDDVIIDIENKMFTHRPDCFGILGIAREIAGISGLPFVSPKWYQKSLPISQPDSPELPIRVVNQVPKLVPRFMVIAMKGIEIQPSPLELQTYLSRLGIRLINNVVDITNYLMQLTGQPLHAYDYDKVKALCPHPHSVEIIVRKADAGEQIKLLSGKTVKPGNDTIMIAAPKQAIGIAGVMGGSDTEVDASTTSIIIECGNFNMYSIRRTSMSLGLFTDAVSRFNKGQSPWQNDRILAKTIDMIKELIPSATVASKSVDSDHVNEKIEPVSTTADFINQRLGIKLSPEAIAKLLENIEFKVVRSGSKLTFTSPFWRTDIAIAEDIVEEVGRLYGYDRLPVKLPLRSLKPVRKDNLLEVKSQLRSLLAARGANELLTYSFVSAKLFEKAGQSPDNAFRITNAKSPDLHYYRQSLTPSLLDKVHANIKAGYDEFALFEINQVHAKDLIDKETKLPIEEFRLSLIVAVEDKLSSRSYSGAAYYLAKKYATDLLSEFNIQPLFSNMAQFKSAKPSATATLAPFEPTRTAIVKDTDGELIGIVGELKPSVRDSFKLPNFIAGFELNVSQLAASQSPKSYLELPRFPYLHQDICLRLKCQISYNDIYHLAEDTVDHNYPDSVDFALTPVDIYQDPKATDKKQITLRLSIASYDKTLTTEEVNRLLDAVAIKAKSEFGAERV